MNPMKEFYLGIDLGTSFIKLALIDQNCQLVREITVPEKEMDIISLHGGWAQQDPNVWWEHILTGISSLLNEQEFRYNLKGIGISYQMHGLVLVDQNMQVLRNSIIWCDSRTKEVGDRLNEIFIKKNISSKLRNHPGNLTLSKLVWVKENQPQVFQKIDKFLLPGDFIFMKMSGRAQTSPQGLSQAILWDYQANNISLQALQIAEIPQSMIPQIVGNLQLQAKTSSEFNDRFGLKESIALRYRSGDQPNNAFSLNVLNLGEVAAAGGTSGTIFSVADNSTGKQILKFNSFLHVNSTKQKQTIGKLLCINGCGRVYEWIRTNFFPNLTYEEMNQIGKSSKSEGVIIIPFGNGCERMLENKTTKCEILNLDLNRHNKGNIIRAVIEGIAFSFVYGAQIMKDDGIEISKIKSGKGNLFQSEIFCEILSSMLMSEIEIHETTGAIGAAKGAGFGNLNFNIPQNQTSLQSYIPSSELKQILCPIYSLWKKQLMKRLGNE